MNEEFLETSVQHKWLYHSGLSAPQPETASGVAERQKAGMARGPNRWLRFTTNKYDASYQLVMRSRQEGNFQVDRVGMHSFVDGQHRWEFALPHAIFPGNFEYKLVLNGTFWQVGNNRTGNWDVDAFFLTDSDAVFGYELKFQTQTWKPAHLVTARTSLDGHARDLYGTYGRYDQGFWHFVFEYDQYPPSFQAALVLDRNTVANGHPVTLTSGQPVAYFNDTTLTFSAAPTAYPHPYENFVSIETEADQRLVRQIPRESDDFDVIVLGSGMGGGTLADALSDLGHRVLVIEAGGIRYPVHINELPREDRDPVGRERLGHYTYECTDWFDGGVTFNLGGRSVYWSGLIPRMTEWEFRDVWPRAIRDYFLNADATGKTGYDHAERLMRERETLGPYQDAVVEHLNSVLPDYETIDLPRSLHQPNLSKQSGTVTLENVLTRSTGCYSTADLLLDSLGQNHPAGFRNLRVALHHLITQIQHSQGKATGVVCQDLVARMQRTYTAKYIVLCCGSVESPKIAINSGLDDPNAKIGKGFNDHPAYFYKTKHALPTSGPLAWLGALEGHAKLLIRHRQATKDSHPYHMEVLINSRYWDLRHMDNDLQQAAAAANHPTEVELKFIFDSELDNSNKITSSGPQAKVNICIHANTSREQYKTEMIQVRNLVLESLGVDPLDLSQHWESKEWSEGIKGTVHHAGGSLRCSHDGSGVVNADLKFEAYDNLYCCDVSVYPSIPAANPSLTLVGLAQRLAQHLSARLSAEDYLAKKKLA